MLRLSIIELFLRLIPEGILYAFAMYAFTNTKKIDIKKILICGILLGISIYLIRFLPIHFGVHTILFLMIYIFISVKIIQVEVLNAIAYGLIMVITLFISEWINVFFLANVLRIPVDVFLGKPLIKILYGLPSLILFCLVIIFIFYVRNYKKVRRN